MLKKSLTSFLAVTMLASVVLPSASLAAPKNKKSEEPNIAEEYEYIQNDTVTVVPVIDDNGSDDEVEVAGKSGYFIKGAMEVIEQVVKVGGSGLLKVVKYLDEDAAKYLSKNSSNIAKGINNAQSKINEFEDYSQKRLSEIIQKSLESVKVPTTYAVQIGDAVAAAVMLLV